MKRRKKILIVIHSLMAHTGKPISGTGSSLFALFRLRKIPFTIFHFPIYGGHSVIREDYMAKRVHISAGNVSPGSLLRRTFMECMTLCNYFLREKHTDIYVGIDPLNAFWGILAKFCKRVDVVVYYTADYAERRFSNTVLNAIYHGIDRFCIRFSDQIWNVSQRIAERRLLQGVPQQRNYYVPNAPLQLPFAGRNYARHRLVIVGTSTTALEYPALIRSLRILKRRYPNIELHIIGELRFPRLLQKHIDRMVRQGYVYLHGALSHDRVQELLSSSGIGLALYKDRDPWTKFGDSMKIREYLSCGLPVITTDVVATSELIRIYGCGLVIRPSKQAIIAAVSSIYDGRYDNMRRSAIRAAKENTFSRIIRQPLSLLDITV